MNKDMNIKDYMAEWLRDPAARLAAQLGRDQAPHALLISGPPGVGCRALGHWWAAALLGVGLSGGEESAPHCEAPDFASIGPEAGKRHIAIEQIRGLIDFLQLTAHRGGRKVALVYPVEALTVAAANSLLKTLEEPPGQSHLVLVGHVPGRLPATIRSRCQQVRLSSPPASLACAWLARQPNGSDAQALLGFAGGAPFLALDLARDGFAERARELDADLAQVAARRNSPTAVARRWARLDTDQCLRWLHWRTTEVIRAQFASAGKAGAPGSQPARLQNVAAGPNIRACFAYLDELTELRRLLDRSLNAELHLTRALDWWSGAR